MAGFKVTHYSPTQALPGALQRSRRVKRGEERKSNVTCRCNFIRTVLPEYRHVRNYGCSLIFTLLFHHTDEHKMYMGSTFLRDSLRL